MREAPPLITVAEGEQFVLETEDAVNGVLQDESRLPIPSVLGEARLRRGEFNPCAGPVFVEGAQPGDVLAVTIHDIVVADQGVTAIRPEFGPLADSARYPEGGQHYTKIIRHLPGPSGTTSDGRGVYDDRLSWDLNPHIGTIGVAPERPVVAGSDTVFGQSRYGGNIDCRDMRKGNVVLLPVAVEGACLYAGDVHGCMADGELYGTADESRAEITLSCRVIRGASVPWVRIETPTSFVQLHSSRPLEHGVTQAFMWTMDWLVEEQGFSPRDAYINLCINPDVRVRVYQMLPSGRLNYTVGVEFPKASLVYG
jgi:acetamidase/formamidase